MNSHWPKKKSEPTGSRPRLQFEAIAEQLLRVVELGQAQDVAAAEHLVGQLQRRDAGLAVEVLAEAVDQRDADRSAGDAGELGHVELGLEPQLPGIGRGVARAAGEIGDSFVAEGERERDALLLQFGPAEIAEQIWPRPEIIDTGVGNRRLGRHIRRIRPTPHQRQGNTHAAHACGRHKPIHLFCSSQRPRLWLFLCRAPAPKPSSRFALPLGSIPASLIS
ncbi:hypothetical protein ACVIJ6_004759 [Bradyrhizobium sp. USDA 4369]